MVLKGSMGFVGFFTDLMERFFRSRPLRPNKTQQSVADLLDLRVCQHGFLNPEP